MSNYLKTTDFAAKDSLPSGDSNKIIRGSEFETEFDNISTAIATKADANNPALTGSGTANNLSVTGTLTAATVDINGGAIDGTSVGSTSASSGAFTTLSASGALTGTTASFSGDLAVDTDTLFVDVSADRVGINTSSPASALDVAGTVTSDGLSVAGSAFITAASNANLQIASTGGNGYQLRTDLNHAYIYQVNRSAPIAQFSFNGNVSFYENTGTTPKMVWDASEENLLLGTTVYEKGYLSIDADISYPNTTNSSADAFNNTNKQHIKLVSNNNSLNIGVDSTLNARTAWLQAGHASPSFADTVNTSELALQPLGGNVGIGTSSPTEELDVAGTAQAFKLVAKLNANEPTIIEAINANAGANASAQLRLNANGNNFFLTNYGDGTATPNITEFLSTAGASQFVFSPNNTERMRIDSSGKLLVKTTSAFTGGTTASSASNVMYVNGGLVRKTATFTDFDDVWVNEDGAVIEAHSDFQAANRPGAEAWHFLKSVTVTTQVASDIKSVIQTATSITGRIYTRYNPDITGTGTWSAWVEK